MCPSRSSVFLQFCPYVCPPPPLNPPGIQVTTWHDAYGTMHMAHTQRVGSEEEQRIEAHKTEVLRLGKQVIPYCLSSFELCQPC